MSPEKSENTPAKKRSSHSSGSQGRDYDNGIIDASPGDRLDEPSNRVQSPRPASTRKQDPETSKMSKGWQQGVESAKHMWSRYVELLVTSFKGMSRATQIQLITNGSRIVCVGITAVALSCFNKFLPLFVRVLDVPLLLVAAWWVGTNFLPIRLVVYFDEYLNKDD